MSKADLKQSRSHRAIADIGKSYQGVKWPQKSLEGAILAHARFENSNLREVDFRGANLMGAVFIRCDLRGAVFHYAQLESVQFIACQLEQSDFRGAETLNVVVKMSDEPLPQHGVSPITHQVRYVVSQGFLYSVFYWTPTQINQESKRQAIPLVLLHGMTGHALDFLQLAQRVQRPVYAIQLIGHGITSYLPLSKEAEWVELEEEDIERCAPSYEEVVIQTIEVIAELLITDSIRDQSTSGKTAFDLLGYSMGARLALHVSHALSSPDFSEPLQIRQTLVIGASLGLQDSKERITRRQSDRQWSDLLWESDDVEAFLTAWNQQPLLARLQVLHPQRAQMLYLHRRTHHPRGLAIAFDSLGLAEMPPLHGVLHTIPNPIFWIYGADDHKYKDIAHQAVELHSLSKMIAIPDTGHAPHLENLKAFWDQVGPILQE